MTETEATIAAIFTEAGWKPNWRAPNDVSRLTFSQDCGGSWNVGGIDLEGTMRWKNTALAPDGPDTPNDPVEAARVLVRVVSESLAIPKDEEIVSRETDEQHSPEPAAQELGQDILAAEAEMGEDSGHGSDTVSEAEGLGGLGQTEQADELPEGDQGSRDGSADDDRESASGVDFYDQSERDGLFEDGAENTEAPIDADFEETKGPDFEALETEDLTEYPALGGTDPPPDPVNTGGDGGAQFIFGDNLDQMRTAAIGLVMRHARAISPPWTTNDDTALIELRNFTMGVSEGRWPDDAGRRNELDALEATLAHINSIAAARDRKVEFLESASREAIEAFDYTEGWP